MNYLLVCRSDELAAEADETGEDPPAEEVHHPPPPPLTRQGRGAAQAHRAQVPVHTSPSLTENRYMCDPPPPPRTRQGL